MPLPQLNLPILQNWSCHNCGGCCREHAVVITPEEQARIQKQNWTPADGIPEGLALFTEERSLGKRTIKLAHQPDGACVFLNEQGLCRIHARFGEEAKPLACRIYPYAFHPSGNRLTVSLRFSCPSVAGNLGKPVSRQQQDLRQLAGLVVPAGYQSFPPPRLTSRLQLGWDDTLRVVRALDQTFEDDEATVAVKILRVFFWIDLLAESKFKTIQGERLDELLELLVNAAGVEIPQLPESAASPSSIGLTQFRLLAGLYARKDTEATIDRSWSGRFRQLKNALKLARGTGSLPALQQGFAELPVSAVERIRVDLSAESEEMLTRYFRVKLQGLHFCGPACYDLPLFEGFQTLSLVYPAAVWLARWKAASDGRSETRHADLLIALTLVDHQHAYTPALGHWPARQRVKNLAASGDLHKLMTWVMMALPLELQ